MLRDNVGFFLIALELSTYGDSFSEEFKGISLSVDFILANIFCLQILDPNKS